MSWCKLVHQSVKNELTPPVKLYVTGPEYHHLSWYSTWSQVWSYDSLDIWVSIVVRVIIQFIHFPQFEIIEIMWLPPKLPPLIKEALLGLFAFIGFSGNMHPFMARMDSQIGRCGCFPRLRSYQLRFITVMLCQLYCKILKVGVVELLKSLTWFWWSKLLVKHNRKQSLHKTQGEWTLVEFPHYCFHRWTIMLIRFGW